MDRLTCGCQGEALKPARDLAARGKIHSFIVLNLSGFMADTSREDFERLRGGRAFAETFKNLRPRAYFVEAEDEGETVNRGHEFQIFRGHLKDNWLFPTFFLDPNQAPPPENPFLAEEWPKFLFHIRFSRTGFLEVKLTRLISVSGESNSDERVIDVLRDLLEIASPGAIEGIAPSLQLKLALHCANLFLQALPSVVEVEERGASQHGQQQVVIRLQPREANAKSFPLHQRYTVLFFAEIFCRKCGHRISAQTFWKRDKKTLAAILEGTLVQSPEEEIDFPVLDDENIKFEDLATWEEELCIFAPERCLIYYSPEYIFLPGQFTSRPVYYEDYWKCIVRGIEHTVAVHAALQIIEWHTTRALDEVPRLTKKVADGEISEQDVAEILSMAQEVANTFNMLPILRDVLVPTSTFRAGYAVSKFAHLNVVLHLKDVQEHIQRNVDELVIFLNHFSSMRLQETSIQLQAELLRLQQKISQLEEKVKENESTLNRVGVIIAVIALLVAGPSFLQDFRSFFSEQYGLPLWTAWGCFVPIGLLALALILYMRDPAGLKGLSEGLRRRKRNPES